MTRVCAFVHYGVKHNKFLSRTKAGETECSPGVTGSLRKIIREAHAKLEIRNRQLRRGNRREIRMVWIFAPDLCERIVEKNLVLSSHRVFPLNSVACQR